MEGVTRAAREARGMVKEDADDGGGEHSGEDSELHALLGAFESYHCVSTNLNDEVPKPGILRAHVASVEGVKAQSHVVSPDPRVFSSHTSLTFTVSRWDADELGRAPVVNIYDLTDAAAAKLNRELLKASLEEEKTRDGLVVSNRGGYHSTPDFLKRVGEGKREGGKKRTPAAKFLNELIEGIATKAGKPVAASVAVGRKRKAEDVLATETGTHDSQLKTPHPKPKHATVSSSWVNVSRPGNRNGLHHHHGAQWSGVYYVAVPETVDESEKEVEPVMTKSATTDAPVEYAAVTRNTIAGNLVLRICSGGKKKEDETSQTGWCVYTSVHPKPGRLVLFPAWTLHGVLSFPESEGRNKAKESERVSIAFNTGEVNEG